MDEIERERDEKKVEQGWLCRDIDILLKSHSIFKTMTIPSSH